MAATDLNNAAGLGGRILAAALLLPGLTPLAHAENPPDHNELAVKFLSYRDSQPGLSRITVNSPSGQLTMKLNDEWSMSALGTVDAVSGASPRYHTAVSGASHMQDDRKALDLRATRYFPRSSFTFGANVSSEHDYRSTGLTAQGKLASEDNNTTWAFGGSFSNDTINSTNQVAVGEHKRTTSLFAGVTQVLTPNDVVQANLGYNIGRGYFSDPYKRPDTRPDSRDQRTLYVGWNHYVEAAQAALRSSYRIYDDSWGVRAHTVGVEWQQPVGKGFSVTPSLRYTAQRAANFYFDPVSANETSTPFPAGYVVGSGAALSADQRLSSFGAITAGIKVDWQYSPTLAFDVALDRYEQRGNWRLGGSGSPGLANFSAIMLQTGLTWRF